MSLFESYFKVNELVSSWAKRGEEPINKMEFRQHVRKLLSADKTYKIDMRQVDELFEELDEDHGGSLDVAELRLALKKLQDSASTAAKTSVSCQARAAAAA